MKPIFLGTADPRSAKRLFLLSRGWPMLPQTALFLHALIVIGLAMSGLLVPGRAASSAGEAAVSTRAAVDQAMNQLDPGRVGRWLDLCAGAASIPLLVSNV